MGRHVAVLIGVGHYRKMRRLPGAINGARQMAAWARTAGYEVVLMTDETCDRQRSTPVVVNVGSIYAVIEDLIDAGDVERLLIYYAGHGQSRGTLNDCWMLPPGGSVPGRSVNVDLTVNYARSSGIEHVIFISDACRTSARGHLQDLAGESLFPIPGARRGGTAVDLFWATGNFESAQEVQSTPETANGVFTDVLLEALRGRAPDALTLDHEGRRLIVPRQLEAYLKNAVPRACGERDLDVQEPSSLVTSPFPPAVIAVLPAPATVHLEYTFSLPSTAQGELVVERLDHDLDPVGPPLWRWPPPEQAHVGDEGQVVARLSVPPGTLHRLRAEPPWRLRGLDSESRTAVADVHVQVTVLRASDVEPSDRVRHGTVTYLMDLNGDRHDIAPCDGWFIVVTVDPSTGDWRSTRSRLREGGIPTPLPLPTRRGLRGSELPTWALDRDRMSLVSPGLIVHGARVIDVAGVDASERVTAVSGRLRWAITLTSSAPRSVVGVVRPVMVRTTAPACWLITAVLPNYVTRLVVGPTGMRSCQFAPVTGPRWSKDRWSEELRILDEAAVAFENGWWEVALDPVSAASRHLDDDGWPVNPTLALLRAYALFRRGRVEDLTVLSRRFVEDHGWKLRDLSVLLDLMAAPRTGSETAPVYPDFPLMTAGWALLPPDVPEWQSQARRALRPAAWATAVGGWHPPADSTAIVVRGN